MVTSQNLWGLIATGGFAMYPLIFCSLLIWGVIFERIWNFRRLKANIHTFHLEAMNALLQGNVSEIRTLCQDRRGVPTAQLVLEGLDRLRSQDPRVRMKWEGAVERKRQLINLNLKRNLWILGTIGTASPFIGLFGTVVGILRSFNEMARTGAGGFSVVAAGISESLIATAAGIVVAVVSVVAFNAFQTQWSSVALMIRLSIEELTEVLEEVFNMKSGEFLGNKE